MKRVILLIISLKAIFVCSIAFAQISDIQILKNKLADYPKEDTTKAILLSELATAYLKNEQYTQGLLTNQKAQTLAQKLNYRKGKGLYLQNLALFHLNNQMFLNYQWQAIDIFEAIGDKKAIKKPISILNFNAYPIIKGLRIDSLKNALSFFKKRQDKAMQADIAQVLAVEYFHQNRLEKTIEYGNKALQWYESVANAQGVACAYFYLIYSFEKQGKKAQAIERELALAKFTDKIKSKKDLAFSLFLIGAFYKNQNRYDLSLDYFLKCQHNIGENNEVLLSYTIHSILLIHNNLSNTSPLEKNKYNEQNSKTIKKVKNDSRVELFLMLISMEIYRVLYNAGKLEEAMPYLSKAKTLAEKANNKFGISYVYDVLGQVNQQHGKYQEAITYFLQAIDNVQKAGEWWAVAYQNSHIARCYQSLGKLHESLKYGLESHRLATENGLGDVQMNTARFIAQIYRELGQYQQADQYYQTYLTFQDSLSKQNLSRKFADIEIQNTIQKSKQEIALLEKDKQIQNQINHNQRLWLFSALGALLSVLVLAFILYRNNQNKQKANKLLAEQKEEIKATLDLVEQERQKSDNLLLNILPEETAAELKATGQAKPKHYDLVSVLFTDFKGFSQIAEKLSPQEVIENLNTCFLALDEICERHHLEKIKTIGDSYMCAGGIPIANTSNPIDCVSAGLEMQTWMANWKAEKQKKGKLAWELRLGIHSGAVVAGVIGKNKFAYDIWGDTVNLASRMESSGEANKVNISGATYELVKDKFQCTYRGKIEAKNKGEVEMYFVEGVK